MKTESNEFLVGMVLVTLFNAKEVYIRPKRQVPGTKDVYIRPLPSMVLFFPVARRFRPWLFERI